ncbi:MAG: T9SS type A sorting domain-containing protein [Bacteroidota bacterium]
MKNLLMLLCCLLSAQIVLAQLSIKDTLLQAGIHASLPMSGDRPVCLSLLPNGNLCYSDLGGKIYEIANGNRQLLFDDNDHHLPYVSHMEVKGDQMYLCGSVVQAGDSVMIGFVMQGDLSTGNWDTLAISAPHYLGLSFNDHRFSSLLIGQDGQHVYVHCGSRTNAGELHELPGVAGTQGLRWEPIRGKLFKLPTDQDTVIYIPNDSSLLAASPYVYLEGLRHLFAMAWGTDSLMYGGSNSDRRDAPEAFYRLEAGEHYGYPWWIGGSLNPLQFASYDPNTDLLLPSGANNQGYYDTDPNFPAMPTGINFVQPYINIGPDADKYRDPLSGAVKDASDEDTVITSFSGHRSPVGLIFDQAGALPYHFNGAGFMVSYSNNSRLLNNDGHDLVQIDLLGGDSISVHQLVAGFIKPIDVMIRDSMIYVLDMGNSNGTLRRIYQISFKDTTTTNTTAIEDFESSVQLSLIPNPSRDFVKVVLSDQQARIQQIRIYDLAGKAYSAPIDQNLQLDLRQLPPQLYMVEIQLVDGSKIAQKLKKE